jgi:hypothetical protein
MLLRSEEEMIVEFCRDINFEVFHVMNQN